MRKVIFALSVTALLFAAGCEKNPAGGELDVPQSVLSAFDEMYPGAEDVQWSSRQSYFVATFGDCLPVKGMSSSCSGRNAAWFDFSGKWYMTEFNSSLGMLPQAVRDAFASSEYASWRVDDVDVLRRSGTAVIYVIEVEGQKDGVFMEVDLYYSEDGVLVKEVVDAEDGYDYGDYIPSRPAESLADAVESLYPGARIVDVDEDDGAIEVEIVDADRIFRELYFDFGLEWMLTKTEVRYSLLPAAVVAAFGNSEYSGYRIDDDIDHYLWNSGEEYYVLELESRDDDDIKIKITPDGTVSVADRDDVNLPVGGGAADGAAAEFINGKYPGAVIVEVEEDDGFIKYEIVHDGKEKDVYFNWSAEWVRTEWDVRYRDLPDAVKQALASYREVDDISFVETPSGSFYLAEVEDGRGERDIRIAPDGTLL